VAARARSGSLTRAVALGAQLARTHEALLDAVEDVRAALVAGRAPGRVDADLLVHCTAFCAALDRHHTAEDGGMLPLLRSEVPALAPTIDKLLQDHEMIGTILGRVAALVERAADGGDVARLVGELDGLAAIMESHFSYEERSIGAALDDLGPGAWTAGVLDVTGFLGGEGQGTA